ncbi:hypothetical protein G4B88_029516 [Cannabis sativa]|uniref:Uncharacterized protein n=1 Tax=Cannabis sativa TaxID=3483 RepID=A0A7J6DUI3_CANSA|nr:hypothetical protein G4B88_029516 [Cannabis sativa]
MNFASRFNLPNCLGNLEISDKIFPYGVYWFRNIYIVMLCYVLGKDLMMGKWLKFEDLFTSPFVTRKSHESKNSLITIRWDQKILVCIDKVDQKRIARIPTDIT